MLKSREQLSNYLKGKLSKLIFDKETCANIANIVHDKHNVPTGQTMDILSERVGLATISEFLLFCLIEALDTINKTNITKIYFTDKEISYYSNAIYEEIAELEFPIIIDCIQVTPDQWIGATDVKFLMELRRAQYIHYNPNAQRTMKKVTSGDKQEFVISINKNAVNQIADSFESGQYIPDDITLNIPYESDAVFRYDDKKKQLVISELPKFEMSDGYHRYCGMSKVSDRIPQFNYRMELRITNFAETKTKQFIFQKDQKTKMSRIDSDSMNMNDPSNIVLENLNMDPGFVFKGQISRNKGLIPFAEFAKIIRYFYFSSIPKKKERLQIIAAQKEIKQIINSLVEYNTSYVENGLNKIELMVLMTIYHEFPELEFDEKIKAFEKCCSNITKEDKKKFYITNMNNRHVKYIKQLMEV